MAADASRDDETAEKVDSKESFLPFVRALEFDESLETRCHRMTTRRHLPGIAVGVPKLFDPIHRVDVRIGERYWIAHNDGPRIGP
jgi:hypothetical protein